MSFAAKANVAMRTTTSVQSSRQLVVAAPVLGPGAPRLAAGRHQQLRPCSALTTAPGQTASEHMNKNFLDVAIGTVLAWFDEPQEQTRCDDYSSAALVLLATWQTPFASHTTPVLH